jgi:very-short-patch-repair endonuclease
MSAKQIRGQVRTGRWLVRESGVYVCAGSPRTYAQAVTVAVLGEVEGAVGSHLTAGFLQGLLTRRPSRIDVTVPHARHDGARKGKLVHRARCLEAADVRRVDGIPVTCPERTLVDLAGVLDIGPLEHALDTALNRRLASVTSIERYVLRRHLRCLRGMGRLRRLLEDRRLGVPGSGIERSFLRLIKQAGLARPTRQHWIGRFRVDFAYPARRIAIELDDDSTHGTASALRSDLRRQNRIVLRGWLILRFTRADVELDAEGVRATLEQALSG